MDLEPTNMELYALALHDAPYVIGAYAIIWLALFGYVTAIFRRILRIEKEIDVVTNALEAKGITVFED